jgi:hypothetical protein
MRTAILVLSAIVISSPGVADTPSQIIDKVKRENPRFIADAMLTGTTLKIGHRNPRGNMDAYAETLCLETSREVHRIQVYDIREIMQKNNWVILGVADCLKARSRVKVTEPPVRF